MTQVDLQKIIDYLVKKTVEVKNKHTEEKNLEIDYVCIFSHSDNEYQDLLKLAAEIGTIADQTPTGPVFKFNSPPETKAGKPKVLKIRIPDSSRPQRGDCDFNTNYPEFKSKYLHKPRFSLIVRPNFEMLELKDPEYDILAYFSSIPLSKKLGIE